jgi:hypothetical protein
VVVQSVREHIEIAIVEESSQDAAVGGVADAVELSRVGYRQRPQQDGMNQSEDGGIRANAQRQRKNDSDREAGALAQPPACVTKVLQQDLHRISAWAQSLPCSVGKLVAKGIGPKPLKINMSLSCE